MSAKPGSAAGVRPDIRAVEEFLYREARLLDEQRWEEWNALFAEDGVYWMPAAPGQDNPLDHVSLIHENALLRAVRIKRFRHPNAFSLQPRPRSSHLVSNVMLDAVDSTSGDCTVSSRFVVTQYRREKQDVYTGACTHRLKSTRDGYRIAMKRVDLLNCDAPLENILIYL